MDDLETKFKDLFLLFDKKGDSKIDSTQLGDVLRALGLNPTEAEIKKIVQEIDPHGTLRLTYEEFVPISLSQKKSQGTMEDFTEGLRVFDKDGSGTICSAELRHVLTSLGEKLTGEEVDSLLTGVEDNQGQLNFEEFLNTVLST